MQCRNCGYRLWNLPSRKCPECGIEFKPSEFKFAPNSVRFCCPHCEQTYYGTDPNGHLVPQAFACASCGQSIHMDDMILLPAEDVEEESTVGLEMPWLQKDRIGFWRRWFRTVGWALVRPQQLMRLTPAAGDETSAWIFALFTSFLIVLVATLPIYVLGFIAAVSAGPVGWVAGIGPCCGVLVIGPIVTAIVLLLWGAITHGLLRLSGPTEHPMERTCQAICYSSGANIVTAIPCMGFYVGWIWWLVGAVLMVKEGQRVGGWRAAIATLVPPLTVIGALLGTMIWAVASGISSGAFSFPKPTAESTSAETQVIAEALVDYAARESGAGPGHAIELVMADDLTVDDFESADTYSTTDAVLVTLNISLEDFRGLPSESEKSAAQKAIDALPKGVIAHRLGDFVFTYHGVDFENADPSLWVVVWSPDPDLNLPLNPQDWVAVGLADGTARAMTVNMLLPALSPQNKVRAAQGLPPLKNPLDVTHDKPQVASPTRP